MSLSVKDLKSRLDDSELDLSMMELDYVPVKELNSLRKATSIDLSANRLVTLPADFASLTHLVRLDLSQNRLQLLPDNFGSLRNLQHLDLYKNKLESLPVSMCQLKSLKWLDLKDNPLRAELSKVAGDCLDDKQCRQCASGVVAQMQSIQSDQERRKQKDLAAQREADAKRAAEEEAERKEMQAAKKKEKEKRKAEKAKNRKEKENTPTSNGNARTSESPPRSVSPPTKTNKTMKRQDGNNSRWSIANLCSTLMSLFSYLLLLSVCVLGLSGALLYHNCASHKLWLPNSNGLCQDLYMFTATGNVPPSAALNIRRVADGSVAASKVKMTQAWDTVRTTDYGAWCENATQSAKRWAGVAWNATKDTTSSARVWFGKNAVPFMDDCWKETKKYSLIGWENTKVGARWAANQAFYATQWTIETTASGLDWTIKSAQDVYSNREAYWNKLKYYWNNMK